LSKINNKGKMKSSRQPKMKDAIRIQQQEDRKKTNRQALEGAKNISPKYPREIKISRKNYKGAE
jgi:hypothetical protein